MPENDKQNSLMPSVLFRLIDPESMHGGTQMGYNLQQIVDAIRSDLEDLFNTRQSVVKVPKQFAQLQNSILTYGIPDMTFFNPNSAGECQSICKTLIALINRFEPRLRNVRASVVKGTSEFDRQARFHIEGQLNVDPAPDVGFDTIVELTSGKASVEAKSAS